MLPHAGVPMFGSISLVLCRTHPVATPPLFPSVFLLQDEGGDLGSPQLPSSAPRVHYDNSRGQPRTSRGSTGEGASEEEEEEELEDGEEEEEEEEEEGPASSDSDGVDPPAVPLPALQSVGARPAPPPRPASRDGGCVLPAHTVLGVGLSVSGSSGVRVGCFFGALVFFSLF
jgi:hypothetical protein